MTNQTQRILLQSGTNEMELLEFYLQGQSFGVNVAKIRQLMPLKATKITRLPQSHESVLGTVLWQDQSITLIDLNHAFGKKDEVDSENQIVLVAEFNQQINGFLVDGVNRIHRIHWDQMQPTGSFLGQFHVPVISTVTVEKNDILLVDLEHVIAKINKTDHAFASRPVPENIAGRSPSEIKLLLAEDSATIQAVVLQTLAEAGYTNVIAFDNGGSAYNRIRDLQAQAQEENRPMDDFLDLVITDIEMPQMDGLTLCHRVKTELNLNVPVVVFSSLVSDAMQRKCESVNADANVSKADAAGLVDTVDRLLVA